MEETNNTVSPEQTSSEQSTEVTSEQVTTEEVTATVVDEATGESTETLYADKFKSVSDLEKSYKELQSTFSKKLGAFEGSPEEYALPEGVEEASPTFEFAAQWGKDNNLSEKGLHSLVQQYQSHQDAQIKEYQSEQMKMLGKNADERVKNAVDWVKGNLGDEFVDAMNTTFMGAKGVEAIEKMRSMTSQSAPTSAPVAQAPDMDSLKAMRFARDEFGNRRMATDPAYRARVNALEEQALKYGK